MSTAFISPPHRHGGATVSRVMLLVAAALAPGILAYAVNFGAGVLVQCLLAVIFALAVESAVLLLRRRRPAAYLKDGSAVVTALLFAVCIPPLAPWWVALTGMLVAIGVAKHAFGGLGLNPFNPAMAGYVFVLLCFPVHMNQWPAAPGTLEAGIGLSRYLAAIFTPGQAAIDALTGATPLGHMKSGLAGMAMVEEIRTAPAFGALAGRGWDWVAGGYLAGGIALLALGVIQWRIPAAMLAGLLAVSMAFHLYDPNVYASPVFHLFAGAALLGAFFIATDPVTASTTPRGRLIYGALIGVLAWMIRTWGAYPDGVAFAVLMANAAAPLIDHFTRPKVLGEGADGS